MNTVDNTTVKSYHRKSAWYHTEFSCQDDYHTSSKLHKNKHHQHYTKMKHKYKDPKLENKHIINIKIETFIDHRMLKTITNFEKDI